MPTRSIRVLLDGLIDYAGLFPPARLSMRAAVEEYARQKQSEHAWALGRFICPASRLDEFTREAAALMPGTNATSGYRERADAGEPWGISALIDAAGIDGLKKDLDRIDAFNERHSAEDAGLAHIDNLELKAPAPGFIDEALDVIPSDLFPFFEFPLNTDCRGFVAALAGNGAAAKVRTGGITPDLIPAAPDLAAFLVACAAGEVPFKATAGLHHPVRSDYPLDSTPQAPRGTMHGFLNVFIAAAIVKELDADIATTRAILEDRIAGNFRFTETVAAWRDRAVETTELALVRERFALSFGSCSFDEPVADLGQLSLL